MVTISTFHSPSGNSDLLPIKWSDATPVKPIVSELVTKTTPSTGRKQRISKAELI